MEKKRLLVTNNRKTYFIFLTIFMTCNVCVTIFANLTNKISELVTYLQTLMKLKMVVIESEVFMGDFFFFRSSWIQF